MLVQARDGCDRRTRRTATACLALIFCALVLSINACGRRSTLPAGLNDREFWALIEELSEPAGRFTLSDNVVSNEPRYADSVRWLRPNGGVYIGVGPEQNFSYIAGLRPAMAFIVDIRRENLDLHLLYKALFEISSDRVEFVSRLFSRPRAADLRRSASVDAIFERYDRIGPSVDEYVKNTALVRERLRSTRGFPLSQADLDWIDRAFGAFYSDGPDIDYYGSSTVDAVRPSYRQLMTARDLSGKHRSFLASEAAFQFVKELHTRNLIVPLVGDFGGPTAFRRIGDYVRARGSRIRAIYGSNVGVYLSTQQTSVFCGNLASLPATGGAWFIESSGMRSLDAKLRKCPSAAK